MTFITFCKERSVELLSLHISCFFLSLLEVFTGDHTPACSTPDVLSRSGCLGSCCTQWKASPVAPTGKSGGGSVALCLASLTVNYSSAVLIRSNALSFLAIRACDDLIANVAFSCIRFKQKTFKQTLNIPSLLTDSVQIFLCFP